MAQSLRLRRALTSVSSFLNCHRSLPSPLPPTPLPQSAAAAPSPGSSSLASHLRSVVQSRGLTGSGVLSAGERQLKLYKEGDEITEDTILFEGCDYNHWLITVDFPKDPKPSPEEMVATYERICAQGLNISIEEAKQKIYACSTTTYQGFQAVMTEEESEKFKDIPGVVFVLPDSYIDPQNKEYGGDKYINGMIIPRPPPVQFQKQRGGRPRRNFDQPRYDQQGGPNPNTQYNQQGYMQGGGRNYGPQQNYPPQQNYGTTQNIPPQRNYGPSQNIPPQQNYGPPQNIPPHQNYGPPQTSPPQQNYVPPQNIPPQRGYGPPQNLPPQQNHGPAQNFSPQQNFGGPQNFPPQQNYGPPGQGDRMPMNNRNFGPGGRDTYQTNRADPVPSYQNNYNQGNYYQDQTGFPHGGHRDYGPPGQRDFSGDNRNYSTQAGNYGQSANPVYGQGYPSEGQSFSQQRN